MPRVAVIIPFYQRERDILRIAVNSALAQSEKDLIVVVVDDGSPVSAREELAPLIAHDRRIMIVEQPNQGPGAARNRGLDATPDDVTVIAFLDSDDQWLPGHLANGLKALRCGADFYFAEVDDKARGRGTSYFDACHFDRSAGEPIPSCRDLFFYKGHPFDIVVPTCPIATSAVIFRRSMASELRFPQGLIAGEDRLFWLGLFLLSKAKNIAFSTRCDATYGRGVNIYASSTWGTPTALRTLFDTARSYRIMKKEFRLTPEQRRSIAKAFRGARTDFASNLVHFLHHRKSVDWRIVREYATMDPHLVSTVLGSLVKAARPRSDESGKQL